MGKTCMCALWKQRPSTRDTQESLGPGVHPGSIPIGVRTGDPEKKFQQLNAGWRCSAKCSTLLPGVRPTDLRAGTPMGVWADVHSSVTEDKSQRKLKYLPLFK